MTSNAILKDCQERLKNVQYPLPLVAEKSKVYISRITGICVGDFKLVEPEEGQAILKALEEIEQDIKSSSNKRKKNSTTLTGNELFDFYSRFHRRAPTDVLMELKGIMYNEVMKLFNERMIHVRHFLIENNLPVLYTHYLKAKRFDKISVRVLSNCYYKLTNREFDIPKKFLKPEYYV